jgi:hypothetical protein
LKRGSNERSLAGSDGTSDYRLDKGHLDGREASLGEDVLDEGGSGNGVVIEEGVGLHADGENKRAEGLRLPGIGVGEGVYGRPLYANGVEAVVDALGDREPSEPNWVTVDRASLTFDALGLRALADLPVGARLEDTGSATAIKVAVGVGILVSEADRLGVVPRGDEHVGGKLVPDLFRDG